MLATKDMRELKLEMPSVQLQVAAAALASERAENAAAMAVQKYTATAPDWSEHGRIIGRAGKIHWPTTSSVQHGGVHCRQQQLDYEDPLSCYLE